MIDSIRNIASKLRWKMLPYRSDSVSREKWEAQYGNGSWDSLKKVDELARYSVIAGYACHFRKFESVLDIGCGEGILHGKFLPFGFSRYVGIDISEEAVRLASRDIDEKSSFLCKDAAAYIPDQRFDTIIFNECLYYFEQPLDLLIRYERFLKDDGLVIASMHAREKTKRVWGEIASRYEIVDSTIVTNRRGTSWKIACWKSR